MRKTINSNKLQFDTVRFSTSSDNISLIEGKEHLFKHTLDIEGEWHKPTIVVIGL